MSRTPAAYLPLLNDGDCDVSGGHWGLVRAMVEECGTELARDASIEWCLSTDNATRATGLDVLGHLANDDERLVATLLDQVLRAAVSTCQDLRWSAAVALQDKTDARVQPLLIGLLGDPDPDVRWQAVYALPGTDDLPPEHPVLHALIRAMQDPSAAVRDWATFGLGSQSAADSPQIREALVGRLADADPDTAAEAAVGLARRRDVRVYLPLVRALADPDLGDTFAGCTYLEAAALLADPRLLPALYAVRGRSEHEADRPWHLDDAISACEAATVRCRAQRRLHPPTVTADGKVARSGGTGCGTRLRTSSRTGSRPWRSA